MTEMPVAPIEHAELPEGRYSDRELSWLAFNNRVLDLAKDSLRVPLLERAKFLAIFSSNLDEFYMVRVAGLKRRIDAGVAVPSNAGIRPRDLHDAILTRTAELVAEQARVFSEDVRPALEAEGIRILSWHQLAETEQYRMHQLFSERIFPVLTPLAVDPSHPFPYISGLSINLAVLLRHPVTGGRQFARVKVPAILARFIALGEGRFVPLEEVIVQHLDEIFSGMQVLTHTTFRVTRNEDLEVEEDDAENILFALEKELLSRKVGRPPVRLEVEDTIEDEMLELLMGELDISEKEVFKLSSPLDLTGLFALTNVDREHLSYPGFLPKTHPDLALGKETSKPADIFTALRNDTEIPKRPAAPRVEVAPSQISVQLLGTGDSATAAYDDFQTAGYALASTPVPGSYTATTIEYDPGYDVSLKTLQAALPGAKAVEVPGLGATFRVTIGEDYAGVTAVSVKDPTESDQPRTANDDLCG